MRQKIMVLAMVMLLIPAALPLFAQISDLDTFSSSFEDFSTEFARSLPMNSSIGLNWSDAYIGQLLPIPSVGVGVTTGFTTIPIGALEDLVDDLGLDSGSALGDIPSLGVPLPGYAFDARVGGLFLPFDVGIKFGTIPDIEVGDVTFEYTNFGIDLRYALIEGSLILPKVSVGVGYNHLSGRVSAPMGIGDTTIDSVEYDGTTYVLSLSDPDIEFDWSANIVDVKAQVSKQFLMIEPHFGLGASYGRAKTNAGFDTTVAVDQELPEGVTLADLGKAAGVDIEDKGIGVSSDVSPFAIRAFAGASLNVALFRLDLGGMYNFNTGALGATVGARVQL
jgi:hypothetical protein